MPKDFENKKLEIRVKIVDEDEAINETNAEDIKRRGMALSARFGKAKFKDYIIRKDDV